jgi:hypothetical protein
LKTILFFRCNEFLEWSIENNGETIEFKNPETNVRKFADALILSKYNDPMFVECLSQMNARFFKRKARNTMIYNTLRMTANEIV